MTEKRRLGRGLEALLGRPADEPARPGVQLHLAEVPPGDGSLLKLNVYQIEANPFQPRRDFDPAEIAGLAQSIQEHGLLQPIVVRKLGERYQLISGERRLRAAIKAGWSELPAQVREADDRQVAELAIVENLQRKDLNALEKAASFQLYLQRYGCTQEELAKRLNVDRSTVANLVRLLELPAAVQDAVRAGTISPGHARALLPLGDEREQLAFCQRIQAEQLSVRAVEEQVQETIRHDDAEPLSIAGSTAPKGKSTAKSRGHSKQVAALEQQFRAAIGSNVDIKHGAKGHGKIVIHFADHAEFERLRDYICGSEVSNRAVG